MNDPNKLKALLLQSFREESGELIVAIQEGFLAFQSGPDAESRAEAAKNVYRACHSLKGAARAVEQAELEGLSALLEEKFRKASKPNTCGFSEGHLKTVSDSLQALQQLIETESYAGDLTQLLDGLESVKAVAPVLPPPPAAEPETAEPAAAAPTSLKDTLLAAFQEESSEIVSELRRQWTALKQSPLQLKEISQDIFRHFHTLKGGARAIEMLEVEMLSQSFEEKFRSLSRHPNPRLSSEAIEILDQGLNQLFNALPGGSGVEAERLSHSVQQIEALDIELAESAPLKSEPKEALRQAFREEQGPLLSELTSSLEGALEAKEPRDGESCLQVACRASHSLKVATRGIDLAEAEAIAAALEQVMRRGLKAQNFFLAETSRPPIEAAVRRLQAEIEYFLRGTPVEDATSLEPLLEALAQVSFQEGPTQATLEDRKAPRLTQGSDKLLSRRLIDVQNRLIHQASSLLEAQADTTQLLDSLNALQREGQVLLEVSAADSEMSATSERLGKAFLERLEQLRRDLIGLDCHLGDLCKSCQEDSDLYRSNRIEISRRLNLPETIARRSLLVQIGIQSFLIPSDAIVLIVPLDQLRIENGQAHFEGQDFPLVSLTSQPAAKISCGVLLKQGERSAFLQVSEVGAVMDTYVQQPGWPIESIPGYQGFAVVHRRKAVPVVDVEHLLRNQVKAPEGELDLKSNTRVLLVDDSLTSRQLLKAVLEGGGYEVQATIHGQQAYDTLVAPDSDFDILVSDVEMPKMTGLELLTEVRKLERFAQFPIVLISTLDSPEHRKRGIDAGADAYVGKGDFNSTALVDTIQGLLTTRRN